MPKPAVAIALRYSPEEAALPIVTASGRGFMAERIEALGRASGVPVLADPMLASTLVHLEPGSPIPPAAFTAVAEILVHLFRLNERVGATRGG